MSIRDAVTKNAELQQQRIDEKHEKEIAARPDAMHRAVHFLLQQIVLNNRDAKREADFHMRQLDEELAVPEKIEEIPPDPDPTETAAEAAAPDAPPTPKVRTASTDTAGSLRTSKRFRRNP